MSTLNIAQEIQRSACTEFSDTVLTSVTYNEPTEPNDYSPRGHPASYSLCGEWCFNVDADKFTTPPKEGDTLRSYGSFGRPVIGVDLNGEPIYFKTEYEQDLDFAQMRVDIENRRVEAYEKNREKLDEQIAALPEVFRARIERFKKEDAEFVFNGMSYELFCLSEAAKVLEHFNKDAAKIEAFRRANYKTQKEQLPTMDYGAHSGNTFGAACAMAERVAQGVDI